MFRQYLHRRIPSMFHRRLLMLSVVMVVASLVLAVQASRLTSGTAHRQALEEAEQRLRYTTFIPTVRGTIYDRQGRVLAVDQPGWDVVVDYRVIGGGWAFERAMNQARRERPEQWRELSPAGREALIDHYRQAYDVQTEHFWQTLAAITNTPIEQIDRRTNRIRQAVQQDASHLWYRWRMRRQAELDHEVSLADVIQPIVEERQGHAVVSDINDSVRLVLQEFIAGAEYNTRLPESERDPILDIWQHVTLERPKHRHYPLETMTVTVETKHMPSPVRDRFNAQPVEVQVEGLGLNIIGLMREAWGEDIRDNPFTYLNEQGERTLNLSGYRDGDEIGMSGVEATMESFLRGSRGQLMRRRDIEQEQRIEPVAGMDVQLTIDIALQAEIQAIMSQDIGLMRVTDWHPEQTVHSERRHPPKRGDQLSGAAVVIDVATSEILAAVSVPETPLRLFRDEPEKIYGDPILLPWLNRPFAMSYLPGSTIKPMILLAAQATGRYYVGEEIFCRGHLEPNHPDRYRCWIFKRFLTGHGSLNGRQAIEQSCNIFFYTLGERMGSRRLVTWMQQFGLGRTPNTGLDAETAGTLPNLDRADEPGAPGFTRPDAIFMGIGQGPIGWSPVQAANAYATLARNGLHIDPTVIRAEHRPFEQRQHRLNVSPEVVHEALQGLEDVIYGSRGTGRYYAGMRGESIFNVEGVRILGKSGTAQAAPLREPIAFDERGFPTRWGPVLRDGDHGWFTAIVKFDGESTPRYAIAVVVDYGGSGSNVAGPVLNQIIHVLKRMRDEGQLD